MVISGERFIDDGNDGFESKCTCLVAVFDASCFGLSTGGFGTIFLFSMYDINCLGISAIVSCAYRDGRHTSHT